MPVNDGKCRSMMVNDSNDSIWLKWLKWLEWLEWLDLTQMTRFDSNDSIWRSMTRFDGQWLDLTQMTRFDGQWLDLTYSVDTALARLLSCLNPRIIIPTTTPMIVTQPIKVMTNTIFIVLNPNVTMIFITNKWKCFSCFQYWHIQSVYVW